VTHPIKVDIWSDVQCPWCYIGKRKFEAAVADFDGDVEVEYHSFELSPDTPVDYDGTPAQYLAERKGISEDQVEQMLDRVTGIAKSVGLDYDYGHMHQTNTVKAHELIHYAKAQGRQLEMKEALLKAYFLDGGHVGRIDDLVELATREGFDPIDVRDALETNRHLTDVKQDVAQAQAYGINGVPFFVFEGQYGVSGAQESATFANVLQQVRDAKEPAA
jgi:predicted DsbA family dithiol-disulfide isomerase